MEDFTMRNLAQCCLRCNTIHKHHDSRHHCCDGMTLVPLLVHQTYSDWAMQADKHSQGLALQDLTEIFMIWPSYYYADNFVPVLIHAFGLPKPNDAALMPSHIRKLVLALPEPLQLPVTKAFLKLSTITPPKVVSPSPTHRTNMQAQSTLPFDNKLTFPKPTPTKKPAKYRLAIIAAATAAITVFCVFQRKP